MFCAICYHLYNLKNVKNTHEGVLLLGNTPPWVFFMFFKLCKWRQIPQHIAAFVDHLIKDNFPKLKSWTHVKCNPVIQFKEFPRISEKIELHHIRWKNIPRKNKVSNTTVERK